MIPKKKKLFVWIGSILLATLIIVIYESSYTLHGIQRFERKVESQPSRDRGHDNVDGRIPQLGPQPQPNGYDGGGGGGGGGGGDGGGGGGGFRIGIPDVRIPDIGAGGGVSATPPPVVKPVPNTDFSAIDAFIEKMPLANIVFNAPKSIDLGSTTIIHLLLGMQKTVDELKEELKAEGEKRGAEIRISPEMEARLTGSNFTIKALTPEKQAVSKIVDTEWKWEVKPESIGKHQLHLTLSATVFVGGQSMIRTIRTFDETIDVEVTWKKQATDFFENNWQWLWTTLLIPLAGWIWAKKKKKEEIGI